MNDVVTIYHDREPMFGLAGDRTFPDDFLAVAEVTTDDLEQAFYLTNHVHNDWTENARVRCIGPAGHPYRSTSVGDVAVKGGYIYSCAVMGWERVAPLKDGVNIPLGNIFPELAT